MEIEVIEGLNKNKEKWRQYNKVKILLKKGKLKYEEEIENKTEGNSNIENKFKSSYKGDIIVEANVNIRYRTDSITHLKHLIPTVK